MRHFDTTYWEGVWGQKTFVEGKFLLQHTSIFRISLTGRVINVIA